MSGIVCDIIGGCGRKGTPCECRIEYHDVDAVGAPLVGARIGYHGGMDTVRRGNFDVTMTISCVFKNNPRGLYAAPKHCLSSPR